MKLKPRRKFRSLEM